MIRKQTDEANKEIKQTEGKQKLENLINEVIDIGTFFELATNNKIIVNGLKLHESKNEISLDYTGDFDLNGLVVIGPIEHKTSIRFKNKDDFES